MSNSKTEPGQAIKSAVARFPSKSCTDRTHQCPERRLLEDGVAGELGERAELDDHGADARRARHRGLPARHAVAQIDRAVGHARGGVEGGEQPECDAKV